MSSSKRSALQMVRERLHPGTSRGDTRLASYASSGRGRSQSSKLPDAARAYAMRNRGQSLASMADGFRTSAEAQGASARELDAIRLRLQRKHPTLK